MLFVAATLAFVAWLSWPLVTFWMLLLTGFVGGRITVGRADRYAHLLALVLLVSEILIAGIPPMVDVTPLIDEAVELFTYGVALVPLALMCLPGVERAREGARSVDFLYGLNVSLLTTILALGSLLSMFLTGALYPEAVIQTTLAIALFLLVISWLWAPFAGFSGLGPLWERYLHNIGTPLERWLGGLAQLARRQQTPEEFLAAASDRLVELPWVAGVSWSGELEGERGERTKHSFGARADEVQITVYVDRPLGTALLMHGRLLLQLVAHFHTAKRRELELTRQAHLRAVYETGARLTHDIKNLLQSLHTLGTALQVTDESRRQAARALAERQLPHITQRLQRTLDKLQAPGQGSDQRRRLSEWWHELTARNAGDGIGFEAELEVDPTIPAELFDSVIENLLENARTKRLSEPEIRIDVSLKAGERCTRLRVSDTGSALDPEIAKVLFHGPVKSRSGLGIGLYQAAKHASQLGYRLALGEREKPGVCFELVSES